MSRSDSFLDRYRTFVAAALIAAHANSSGDGFRQRDIRFLLDLFTNWVEGSYGTDRIVGTQVLRILEDLVAEGFAKRTTRSKAPHYRLNRIGLVELLSWLSQRPVTGQSTNFFFLYYFLSNYGPRIMELIRNEGRQYPPAMRAEIEQLLDVQYLIVDEATRVERQIQQLEQRIASSLQAAKMWDSLMRSKVSPERAFVEMEKKFPYDLNSQKPLSELLSEVPVDLAVWEMAHGSLQRPEQLWKPRLKLLKSYHASLLELRNK